MKIERARYTRSNMRAVLCLIDDASSWLRTKDTDQWAEPWPTRDDRNARVRNDLREGKTWIVWNGKTPAATVTIAEKANIDVWSASRCDLSEPAVYVHRLVTARGYSGLGLGAELIDWAGLRGLTAKNAQWIRIDVWSDNLALHDFYMKQGFEACGRCANPDYPSGALFQKPVSDIGQVSIPPVSGTSAVFSLAGRKALAMA
jgi:GNAT superfamily N-acetyltransferase